MKRPQKSSLKAGAENIVAQNLNIQLLEKVLVVTDTKMLKFGRAIFEAAKKINLDTNLLVMPPTNENGAEPNSVVANAMKAADVVIAPTYRSITHTKARREATRAGARIATMPDVPEFSFTHGGLTADLKVMSDLTEKMYYAIKGKTKVRVESKNGTDVSFVIGEMILDKDKGIIHNPGQFGNLPAGEVDTAPNEGSANGIVVFDDLSDFGKKIKLKISNGSVDETDNKKLDDVFSKMPKARNIAEFGIGTNPKSKVIGNTVEDEKCMGTCHIALGNNLSYGGRNDVPFHKDGIIFNPTIIVDRKIILRDGKWLI